jgi:hypothetical protein
VPLFVLTVPPHLPHRSDDAESDVIDAGFSSADAWACHHYAAGGGSASQGSGEPMFCVELGLAIEAPKEGASIAQLWSIL